ncbi:polysaccharide biosynthesis tyrosine autokinase [Deinococcus sp. JMULE3]|uniref:polysaccharide biosynthesis tyrosine autokinase n=1 Tax=Deinococcus sp. JMULE3 TaxID=2518341 RepID=UPI0015763D0A|nr:polysaccharide biosynthesis tyrosine autokinase [Deinococcus sp. JMULE3]NTY01071.1 chromosome partitioning protein [Deinococcus sp. JMULE3]
MSSATQIRENGNSSNILTILQRRWMHVLLPALLVGPSVYISSRNQPPTYQASTSLMSVVPDTSNSFVGSASITASQLPPGAVEKVIHSRSTVEQISKILDSQSIDPAARQAIERSLQQELSTGTFRRITVRARLDALQRGVYDINATAETPQLASELATAATDALLKWDLERAQAGVSRARQNIQQQLDNINTQLKGTPPSSLEYESLVSARGQLLLSLAQASAFEQGAKGNLSLLAEANPPLRPIAPRPTRTAAIATLLALIGAAATVLLLELSRRKIRSAADIIGIGVSVLGELPRLRRSQRSSMVNAAMSGELYEPAGFIRVNLSTALAEQHGQPSAFVVTSSRPGEGKSTVVATLASSFAASGKKVLVIDLDVHRPTQHEYWNVSGRPWIALHGAHQAQQTTLLQAYQKPEHASAIDIGGGIYLLPAGQASRREAGVLTTAQFSQRIKQWFHGFDIVILDSAPILSVADAVNIAPHTNGVVLVTEANGTAPGEFEKSVQLMKGNQVNLIGAIINKITQRDGYGYGYTYNRQYSRD